MKFRIISDLHVDVNEKYPFELKNDDIMKENIITLVAGDVSGDPEIDKKWLLKNTNYHGYVISGNHIVYNYKNKTIQKLQQEEKDLFKDTQWCYLEKDYDIIEEEKIIIFGATLWTDYEIGFPNYKMNMWNAKLAMNDFRFGRCKNESGEEVNLYPDWCRKEHFKTLEILNDVCVKYPDYAIIVLTHHCPSIKSVSSRYWGSDCNGAYVSNLEGFIIDHPNIKVWVCGHVHHPHQYEIGDCHILSNPRGYEHYGETNGWNPDTMNFEIKDGLFIEGNK